MKTTKRLTALVLALVMLLSLAAPGTWATHVHAAETKEYGDLECVHINPLYEDIITEDDLVKPGRPVLYADNRDGEYFYDAYDAGELIRDDLVARDETIIVDAYCDYTGDENIQTDFENLCYDILGWGMVHTGEPTEGDYLLWQYGGCNMQGSDLVIDEENMLMGLTITFTMTYYTDAAQEAELDSAVADLLDALDVYDGDNYTKLRAIYDYICANVTYDYDNLEDKAYTLKHTAYAALMNGTAVCQGYALLLYRLALELGVDCRLIAGDGGGAHGWNIAEIDGLYYNLDSTWDAGKSA